MGPPLAEPAVEGRLVRVTGLVQGVGFRPTVWRIATALGRAAAVRPRSLSSASRTTRRFRSSPLKRMS